MEELKKLQNNLDEIKKSIPEKDYLKLTKNTRNLFLTLNKTENTSNKKYIIKCVRIVTTMDLHELNVENLECNIRPERCVNSMKDEIKKKGFSYGYTTGAINIIDNSEPMPIEDIKYEFDEEDKYDTFTVKCTKIVVLDIHELKD